MTRNSKSKAPDPTASRRHRRKPAGKWLLQDAKARFSELVRRVKTEGPQLVTVHGREEVVVISVEEFRRLKGTASGQALIDIMQASPLGEDVQIGSESVRSRVRDVSL